MGNPDNSDELRQLVHLLSQSNLLTAKQIAFETKCVKSVVYRRIQRLRERGCVFVTQRIRAGVTGTLSVAYAIIPNQASRALVKK